MILVTLCLIFCNDAAALEPFSVSSTNYPSFSQPEIMPGKGNGVLYDIAVEAYNAVGAPVHVYYMPMSRIVWSVIERKDHATLGVINWFERAEKT